jgi:hypothetical protein
MPTQLKLRGIVHMLRTDTFCNVCDWHKENAELVIEASHMHDIYRGWIWYFHSIVLYMDEFKINICSLDIGIAHKG